ncbi:DoxX family protein [Xylanimonas allomyrinae]|uniref:DoxX family protein n=1 Tax=Xylanimonas allomyrinae TaxID=2509459 RepID=A0A4P6EZG6_9MICO|nr:DoxX family protein [Xylanimonas allomyrinae]QAY63458.1 DoxX family protein [Xylanimonas allomyrinae]
MDVGLWVVAGLLAAVYLAVGCIKLLRGGTLADRMPWVGAFPDPVVRFIGLCEVAGALGLVLPQATGKLVWLTPLAASGLALLQLLAILVHTRRQETQQLAVNVVLLILALVVAVGRFAQWSATAAPPTP